MARSARGADPRAALAEGSPGRPADYDTARDRLFQVDADSDVIDRVYTGRTFSIQGGVDYDAVNPSTPGPGPTAPTESSGVTSTTSS